MLDCAVLQLRNSVQTCGRQTLNHLYNIQRTPRQSTTTLNKKRRVLDFSQCILNGESSKLHQLSDEVLVYILEYLDARTLVRLSKSCRLFHRLCHSDVVWRHRCKVKAFVLYTGLLYIRSN